MSNGFWGNMWISCFFIATFHQIAVYSLCLGRSWILIHLMLKFISCRSRQPLLFNHFKTSHVKVYLYGSPLLSSLATNFKTSHVKVYRQSYSTKQLCTLISKHLMLKFILRLFNMWRWWNVISKHLMLKFIAGGATRVCSNYGISKHLMLKFILQVDIFFWYLFKFQNIPC